MSGSSQRVRIETHPDAKTMVDGRTFVGSTSIELSRRNNHVVRVEKQGFHSKNLTLSPGMNGWVWGNLALGPLFPIGVVIDALSGAINDLSPRAVRVSLEAEAKPKPGIRVENEIDAAAHVEREIQDGPPRDWVLAVMEMERLLGDDLEDDLLRALSEQLRVRLAERRWRVVDRTAQEARWNEIVRSEKHESYRSCREPSCQIPLGRALSATHILRTSLARFGGTCVFGAELYELEGEVSIAAGTSEGSCKAEALLKSSSNLLKRLTHSAVSAAPAPG